VRHAHKQVVLCRVPHGWFPSLRSARRAEATRSSASLPLHARRSHRVPELISNPVISGKMPSPFYVCRRRADAENFSGAPLLEARRGNSVFPPDIGSDKRPVTSKSFLSRPRFPLPFLSQTTPLPSHAARTKGSARQCRLHHSSRLQERETGEFIADLQVGAGLARELNRRLGCSVNKFQCRSRSGKRCRRPPLNELRHTQRCSSRLLGPPLRHRGWDNICKN
jgi:hypothetical protein